MEVEDRTIRYWACLSTVRFNLILAALGVDNLQPGANVRGFVDLSIGELNSRSCLYQYEGA